MNPCSFRKGPAGSDIALPNRLPMVNLVESGGADLPAQAELFIPGGRAFRDLTRSSAAAHPDGGPGLRQLHRRRGLRARA